MGITNFYCGMALGFDMLAAEEVISLKVELPNLKLVAVIRKRPSVVANYFVPTIRIQQQRWVVYQLYVSSCKLFDNILS